MERNTKVTLLTIGLLTATMLLVFTPSAIAGSATFTESGLPSGITWTVTCGGKSGSATSPNAISISGLQGNGPWTWSAGTLSGGTGIQYVPSPASGSGTSATITYTTQYQVYFAASSGGSVTTPSSPLWFNKGASSQAISAIANIGYHFTSWTTSGSITLADASSASTTITAVNSAGTVTANFVNTYAITVTQSLHGTISPGTTSVNSGSSQSFSITPESGYHITDVLVDGASVGAVSSYSFPNVQATHTITASYAMTSTATTLTVACTPETVDGTGARTTTISGSLTAAGSPIAGKTITLTYNDGTEHPITTVTTQADGSYIYTWAITSSSPTYLVNAAFTGDDNPYMSSSAQTTGGGLFVLPEYPLGGIGALFALFAAFGIVKIRHRKTPQ